MKHVIYMISLCQEREVSIDIYNADSVSSKERQPVGQHERVLINKYSYRNIDRMAAFRFHSYYVNLLILHLYPTMLQSINLKGVPDGDVISYLSMLAELRRFGLKFQIQSIVISQGRYHKKATVQISLDGVDSIYAISNFL